VKTVSSKVVIEAFIGVSIRAKMIGGKRAFLREWRILTHPCKTPIFNILSTRSYSVVTSSKTVQLTLIGNPLALFNAQV